MKAIPSNFSRYDKNVLMFNSISLSKNRKWICDTKVPLNKSVEETFQEIISKLPESDLLFDGCSFENKEYLETFGFKSLTFGKEAIIDLSKDIFQKKSLQELVRRGKRHGSMVEINYTLENKKELRNFIQKTSHAKKPQLKNLFASSFQSHHRLFVFKGSDKWIAAMMLSLKDKKYIQTELILRCSDAPVGVMEALIYDIVIKLKNEGFTYWSLGAVPFVEFDAKLFSLSWFINFIGRKIRFAYNYQGLFNFKNKFNPIWEPYFLCYKNTLKPIHIFKLSKESNLFKLVFHNILLKFHLRYEK